MTSRTFEKVRFDNGAGDKLAGILDRPTEKIFRATAVFGPCFTCIKESHAAVKISRALAERGVAVLRFDTTGFGESGGDALATNLSTRIRDLVAAARFIGETVAPPRLLIGHSMSGTAALSAVRHIPSIDTLVTIGAPRDSQATVARFRRDGLLAPDPDDPEDRIRINVLGRPVPFYKNFVEDLINGSAAADTARFTGTLIAAHAETDDIVDSAEAEAIVARATAARTAEIFRLPPSAGHLFAQGQEAAQALADRIVAALG